MGAAQPCSRFVTSSFGGAEMITSSALLNAEIAGGRGTLPRVRQNGSGQILSSSPHTAQIVDRWC